MTTDPETVETAVVPAGPPPTAVALWGTNEPVEMVQRMTVIADAMASAVRQRGMTSMIGPKNGPKREYVRAEGWALVGAMVGVFPRTVALDEIREEGMLVGFRATVELVSRDGGLVGGAIALCTIGEERWADRDWNQVASMAQTRANAKAYRQTLGFIMPMANFQSTPAEEMDGIFPESEEREAAAPGGRARRRDAADAPKEMKNVGDVMNLGRLLGLDPKRILEVAGRPDDIKKRGLDASADMLRKAAGVGDEEEPSAADEIIEGEFTEDEDAPAPASVDSVATLLAWAKHVHEATPDDVVTALGAGTVGGIAAAITDQYGGDWEAALTTLKYELGREVAEADPIDKYEDDDPALVGEQPALIGKEQ